ncbi:MAG: hypothetical protein TH68_03185 [Candidatus Synechococcus spongiarum 142]|uniref:Uncharacterized protein n=1 Tax=Candidatus Synechococcus spongiarum 142 TaxID=1608213 RepID=A0A6N3X5L3_9SYNE|nr:MAG: hypothetical protein TH68_03185 [Candidatus Synechococcus spongiarum 142]
MADGFPAFNDRLTITPALSLTLSSDGRTTSLLWALAPYVQQPQIELGDLFLDGQRHKNC